MPDLVKLVQKYNRLCNLIRSKSKEKCILSKQWKILMDILLSHIAFMEAKQSLALRLIPTKKWPKESNTLFRLSVRQEKATLEKMEIVPITWKISIFQQMLKYHPGPKLSTIW